MQLKHPTEVIQILYAGTGPFGALMLPMTTLFSAKEIQFTLIEINPISMNFLKNTVERFGISDYIDEYLLVDATNHQLKNKGTHHILLTETMQQALQNEPQVGICLNLVPQVSPEAVLIPKCIHIDLVLMNLKNNHKRKMGESVKAIYSPIVKILVFNKEEINEILSNTDFVNDPSSFHCVMANITPHMKEEEVLALLTSIEVYSDFSLDLDECSLNMPVIIKENEAIRRRAHLLSFDYALSEKPCFKWREI